MQDRHPTLSSYHFKRAKTDGLIEVLNEGSYVMAEYSERTGIVKWQRVVLGHAEGKDREVAVRSLPGPHPQGARPWLRAAVRADSRPTRPFSKRRPIHLQRMEASICERDSPEYHPATGAARSWSNPAAIGDMSRWTPPDRAKDRNPASRFPADRLRPRRACTSPGDSPTRIHIR